MRIAAKHRDGWLFSSQIEEAIQHQVRIHGEWVDVVQMGHGDPLVLVPGLAGVGNCSPRWPRNWARHYQVTIPGLRGDRFPMGNSCVTGLSDHAADLGQLIDQLGLERPSLFGVSFGGAIALELAVEQPHRIGALVLQGWCRVSDQPGDDDRPAGARAVPAPHGQWFPEPVLQPAPWWEAGAGPVVRLRRRAVLGDRPGGDGGGSDTSNRSTSPTDSSASTYPRSFWPGRGTPSYRRLANVPWLPRSRAPGTCDARRGRPHRLPLGTARRWPARFAASSTRSATRIAETRVVAERSAGRAGRVPLLVPINRDSAFLSAWFASTFEYSLLEARHSRHEEACFVRSKAGTSRTGVRTTDPVPCAGRGMRLHGHVPRSRVAVVRDRTGPYAGAVAQRGAAPQGGEGSSTMNMSLEWRADSSTGSDLRVGGGSPGYWHDVVEDTEATLDRCSRPVAVDAVARTVGVLGQDRRRRGLALDRSGDHLAALVDAPVEVRAVILAGQAPPS